MIDDTDDIESAFPGMKRNLKKRSGGKKRKISAISIKFSDETAAKCRTLNVKAEQPSTEHIPMDDYFEKEIQSDDWESFFADDTHEDQGV